VTKESVSKPTKCDYFSVLISKVSREVGNIERKRVVI
jgi:hypothetical protein